MENTEETTRFCPRCERTLPISKFHKAKKRRDSIRAICKDCERVITSAGLDDLREQVYNKLGHSCNRCGFSDKRALQIDHVFGGGNQEHSEIRSKNGFLRKVLSDTDGLYQILCANCNWIKRFERLEIAHPLPFSPELREKILQSNFGKPISEATRKRISEAGKGKVAWNLGVPAWNRGIPRPESLKIKLSEIATEIQAKRSPEEKSRIARDRDAKMTPEQRSDRAKKAAATKAANKAIRLTQTPLTQQTTPSSRIAIEETDVSTAK